MANRVDIYFPVKDEIIHTIIDRNGIRIGGAGSSTGGGVTTLLVNGDTFKDVSGSYDLGVTDTNGDPVGTANVGSNKVQIADSVIQLKDSLDAVKDTVVKKAEQSGDVLLPDLQYEVRDESDNLVLSGSQPAYSEGALDLTPLQTGIIIGQNTNVVVSNTAPPTPADGDVWFQPVP